jgi:hypothetical protein
MKIRLFILLVAMMGFSSHGLAQEAVRPLKKFVVFGDIGIISARKVEYIAPLGISGGIGLGYKLSHKFAVLANGHYGVAQAGSLPLPATPKTPVGLPEVEQPIIHSKSDVPFRMVQCSGEIRYRFNELQRDPSAYLIAGVSYFNMIRHDLTIDSVGSSRLEPERADKSFGFSAGLGVEFPYTKDAVCLFAELRFSKGTNAISSGNISPFYLALRTGVNVNL